MMKHLCIILFLFLTLPVFGKKLVLPNVAVSEYEDTIALTNHQMIAVAADDRIFTLSISLDAALSNRLEVVFGTDDNSDGVLALEESHLSIGWDSGNWVFNDRRAQVEEFTPGASGIKEFEWVLRLNADYSARSARAKTGGGNVLIRSMRNCAPTYFNPLWNLVRIVSSGIENPNGSVELKITPHGLSIRVR